MSPQVTFRTNIFSSSRHIVIELSDFEHFLAEGVK